MNSEHFADETPKIETVRILSVLNFFYAFCLCGLSSLTDRPTLFTTHITTKKRITKY